MQLSSKHIAELSSLRFCDYITYFHLNAIHLSLRTTLWKLAIDQEISCSSSGIRLLPRSVREYSTRGGISAYSLRNTRPSASSLFSVSVRTFGDISGIALPMALKRVVSFSDNTHKISIAHLPENRDTTFLIGHSAIDAYFLKFSSDCNDFIFKNSYLQVSALHFCNVLQSTKTGSNFALSKLKQLTTAKLVNNHKPSKNRT